MIYHNALYFVYTKECHVIQGHQNKFNHLRYLCCNLGCLFLVSWIGSSSKHGLARLVRWEITQQYRQVSFQSKVTSTSEDVKTLDIRTRSRTIFKGASVVGAQPGNWSRCLTIHLVSGIHRNVEHTLISLMPRFHKTAAMRDSWRCWDIPS